MRHYDRTEFRHLDDAQRYRDPEYKADDDWVGPNEHTPPLMPAPARRAQPTTPSAAAVPRALRRLRAVRSVVGRVLHAMRHPKRAARDAVRTLVRTITLSP